MVFAVGVTAILMLCFVPFNLLRRWMETLISLLMTSALDLIDLARWHMRVAFIVDPAKIACVTDISILWTDDWSIIGAVYWAEGHLLIWLAYDAACAHVTQHHFICSTVIIRDDLDLGIQGLDAIMHEQVLPLPSVKHFWVASVFSELPIFSCHHLTTGDTWRYINVHSRYSSSFELFVLLSSP